MANLQLIKDLAERQGMTIEALAEKVGIKAQSIHLMVRTGSTKIETIEKIATALGVPTTVFFDEHFIVAPTKKYENNGHHNPFAPEGEARTVETADIEVYKDLIKAKDELIAELRKRIKELENRTK